VLTLIGSPTTPGDLRDSGSRAIEGRKTTRRVLADRCEQCNNADRDHATDDRPSAGLATDLVQHELLDLIQHFNPLPMPIPTLPQA